MFKNLVIVGASVFNIHRRGYIWFAEEIASEIKSTTSSPWLWRDPRLMVSGYFVALTAAWRPHKMQLLSWQEHSTSNLFATWVDSNNCHKLKWHQDRVKIGCHVRWCKINFSAVRWHRFAIPWVVWVFFPPKMLILWLLHEHSNPSNSCEAVSS